jgi:hypothetical protein
MSLYPKNEFGAAHVLYDFFTESPIPVSDLTDDVIVMVNRESTSAQDNAHDAKFDFMQSTIGNAGKQVVKKAFTGSGRLKPLYEFNESHGLDNGYKGTWFGDLENTIGEAIRQSFPGQRVTVLFLTPDRLARPQNFHPHNTHTWELSATDYGQIDQWLTARLGKHRRSIRFLTCFAGTPEQCRGFKTKISMHYSGNRGGRPKGSKNKTPRVTLTPKQKTALSKILRAEIPSLVEMGLNGADCYRYLKGHYPVVPVSKRTVQKWVTEERGTPGTPGRPATKTTLPQLENKRVILGSRYKRPSGKHPALIRIKRIQSIDRPLPLKRVKNILSFSPYCLTLPRPP